MADHESDNGIWQKNEKLNKKCSIRTEEHHPGALPLLRAHGFSDRQ